MMFMFIDQDGTWQAPEITQLQLQDCCEGALEIYKVSRGKFYRATPIDSSDRDNWELISEREG